MELKPVCPACHRDDQFVQSDDLNTESPDDTPVTCACGAITKFGALKAGLLESDAITQEVQRLAHEAAARAFGKLLK